MIPYKEAHNLVLENTLSLGQEQVSLADSLGRILDMDIKADRDYPPFDRATKDGIAIDHSSLKNEMPFKIIGTAAAGQSQLTLSNKTSAIEIMTGAVLPKNADTVIMYEHLHIQNKQATVLKDVRQGQNIHQRGSDSPKGRILLERGVKIDAAAIGILASVGVALVRVKKLPKVAVISSGDELVPIEETPLPHQIRQSNASMILAAVKQWHSSFNCKKFHLPDDLAKIEESLSKIMQEYDVVLLCGGVSKGKFDFVPQALEELNCQKIFHKVAQRPGKPLWFGKHQKSKTIVFGFPGNPVSSLANFHLYFLPWLKKSLGIWNGFPQISLLEPITNELNLTRFLKVTAKINDGSLQACPISDQGSGNLVSLGETNGFLILNAETEYSIGEKVPFVAMQNLLEV